MNWTDIIKNYQYVEQVDRSMLYFYCSSKQEADEYIDKINEENFKNYVLRRTTTLGKKAKNYLYEKYDNYDDFMEVKQCGLKLKDFFWDYGEDF